MKLRTDTKVVETTLSNLIASTRFLLQQGGTSSGKTFGILTAIYLYCSDVKPISADDNVFTIVGLSVPHLKDGAYRQWQHIVAGRPGVVQTSKVDRTYEINGWHIQFVSTDDKKAHGGKRRHLFVNEANFFDYDTIEQLEMRTSGTIILDWNPSAKFWAHKKILTRPDVTVRRYITTYKDNPTVPKAIIQKIESWRTENPNKYRVYGLGHTGVVEGLCIPRFDIAPFPERSKLRWVSKGVDFGYSGDPAAVVEIAKGYGRELYVRELMYEPTDDPDVIATAIRSSANRCVAYCDNDKVMVGQLKKKRLAVEFAPKPPGSIEAGLALLNSTELFVDPSSVNIIREMGLYMRRKVGDEYKEPIDKDNHTIDAIRYAYVGKQHPNLKVNKRGGIVGVF